jgi:hypothetical protein
MNETKTGALVCKVPDNRNQFTYQPLAFITGIPAAYTDEDFRSNLDIDVVKNLTHNCHEILFRADIHSTSNEVQEEYEKLHADSGKIPQFSFRDKKLHA